MIKVDDKSTTITGSKVDILGDISQLFKALNEMPAFTEEEVRHAVDAGFWSDEKLEKECTKMASALFDALSKL